MTPDDPNPERGPDWLPAAGAALHLALAVLVAGSAVVLLDGYGREEDGLLMSWIRTLEAIVDWLGAERRRPYVLALTGTAAALPALVGWWDGRRARAGRGALPVLAMAFLATVAGVLAYMALVHGIAYARGVYIPIIARAQLFYSYIVLAQFGLAYVPTSLLAAWLLRRIGRVG